jgi:hypothetical protein
MKYLVLFCSLWATAASAEPMQMIKTVPEGATLEYRIQGSAAQSMNLAPGTYRITIESLSGSDIKKPARRRARRHNG